MSFRLDSRRLLACVTGYKYWTATPHPQEIKCEAKAKTLYFTTFNLEEESLNFPFPPQDLGWKKWDESLEKGFGGGGGGGEKYLGGR